MGEAKRRRLRGCTCPKAEGIILPEHVEGCPARPKATPKFEVETVVLPLHIAKRVSEEYKLSAYSPKPNRPPDAPALTRSEYLALLILAACNHEQKLREEKEVGSRGSVIELHTQLPAGMAEAAARLQALKKGIE